MGEGFADWINRPVQAPEEPISARLLSQFRATLAPFVADLPVPPGLHWCLAPIAEDSAALGPDGHPAKGGFLPPVPLPRRMWAGGALRFHAALQPGDPVTRVSTVESVTPKAGSTGPLCFVTVRHDLTTPRGPALSEWHHIVYRGADSAPAAPARHPADFDEQWQVPVDAVRLFRYSALTFNGHRIHYDHPYATGVEGYAGLVIHGPLMATLMLNLATRHRGALPERFAFRALSPATGEQTLTIGLRIAGAGAELAVRTESGALAMTGTADWV